MTIFSSSYRLPYDYDEYGYMNYRSQYTDDSDNNYEDEYYSDEDATAEDND